MPVPVRDIRGAALVEFALLTPLLLVIMLGILCYGQYFLVAHSVQQVANDAARATVAGLSAAERASLARAAAEREFKALPELSTAGPAVAVTESADAVVVRVTLDARRLPLLDSALLPMPSPVIERVAVVRPGDTT